MIEFQRLLAVLRDAVRIATIAIVCVSMLPTLQAVGQLSSATVNGVVRDPSGAVVPGAAVVLRSVDTTVEHPTTTNGSGAYTLLNITPGNYTLEVKAAAFAPEHFDQFTLTVGQLATLDVTLTVGTAAQNVTVEATAGQLEVSNADLGTVIATKQVNDLPLNGRNFTQLLSLTPGVVPISTGQNGMGGRTGGFSAPVAVGSSFTFPAINGQGNRSNFFLTDGLNNYGSLLSTYATPPIVDAIQEFKVVSHTDGAEYGSVLGGVVNVVTKSGSNSLHGSGWEFARNSIFDSRPYNFLTVAAPKGQFSQNQFGGSLGGPVWIPKLYNGRNKTFFFGAYQGFRYSEVSNIGIVVPTAAQLAGDESGAPQIYNPFSTRANGDGTYTRDPFPGNIIPQNLIDQRMVAYAQFVLPKASSAAPFGQPNAFDTTPLTQVQNEFTARVDQTFGQKNSAWFRYSFINSSISTSGGVPGLPKIQKIPSRNWGGSFVHIFTPSLTMQVQYARTTVQDNASTRFKASTANILSQVGFDPGFVGHFVAAGGGGSLVPGPGINGYASPGEIVENTPKATDSHQLSGSLTKTFGNHELHIGSGYISNTFASPISYPQLTFLAQETANPSPQKNADGSTTPSGDAFSSFLLNSPDGANRRNVDEETRPGGVFSAFVQDSWKASQRLTLNIGLRYDFTFIPPYGTNGTIGKQGGIETGDMDLTNGTYILQKVPPTCAVRGFAPCIPGDGTLPAHVVVDPRGKIAHNVGTNLGPRFGFAYKADDKTVIRGAFGIVFDNWAAISQTAQNIEGSWPDIGQQIANNLNQPTSAAPNPGITAQNPFAATGGGFPAPTPFNQVQWFYDPNIKNAYAEQFNFGFQRQINNSTAVTMNYVGSVSRRVDIGGYYNTALTPGPGDVSTRNLYSYITPTFYERSNGSANYNAFQFQLDKRYSNGLAYQVAYTWSKAMNEGGDGFFGAEGGVPVDPYHPAAYGSYSVAGYDLTHVLSVNALAESPFGTGKRFATSSHAINYILGNWQLNNIFSARSGQPFTPTISSDIANTGNVGWSGYEHANLVGHAPLPAGTSKKKQFFNTANFVSPDKFTFGTSGRNSMRGARYWNLDTSIFRQFPFWGEKRLEFRGEAFNLLNNVIYGQPNSDLNSGTSFGSVSSTANTARQLQLGAKLIFYVSEE